MRKRLLAEKYRPILQLYWPALAIAIFQLAAVIVVDYLTGKDVSFTLLYLVPISTAVWFVGRKAGLVFCILSAIASLAMELVEEPVFAKAFWNTGIRLGLYLTFSMLLSYAKEHSFGEGVLRRTRRRVAIGLTAACVLALGAGIFQGHGAIKDFSHASLDQRWAAAKANGPLAEIGALLEECMRTSRGVLLGSRDPMGPSCVSVSRTGDVREEPPVTYGDLNGGPGTTMGLLYTAGREQCKSPQQDFVWHQTRLKSYLENEAATNRPAGELAHELAEKTRQFSEAASSWSAVPHNLKPSGYSHRDDWPSYCMASLEEAIARGDAPAAKRWSNELAAAAFSLDDLHRWLGFLVQNQLAALEFQSRCETLFAAADPRNEPYVQAVSISRFPAGVLGTNGMSNYFEVERQAERMFTIPADGIAEIATDQYLTEASIWVPPGLRECYLKLQDALSPDNQKVWQQAARTPYHHSYLVNMLYRAVNADTADELFLVLKKFDGLNPHSTIGPLLGVLMYRGHSFAGLEWGDRFQPALMRAADEIPPAMSDLEALEAACRWTNRFYKTPAEYTITFTLRDALETKKLDCVRATDMIGAIFRNAGRSRFGHVRWCCETGAHSVAAYTSVEGDHLKPRLVDGMMPPEVPEVWPDCYFHGHAWPPGLEDNAQPYAMELYVRGLDSYIWAEGYIVRGPNAGWLTTAAIPYSTHRQEPTMRKVFDGPYPQ